MKVLMLGWEYPPHKAGGLGTACEGITRGLARLGKVELLFVMPQLYGGEYAPHMTLIDALAVIERQRSPTKGLPKGTKLELEGGVRLDVKGVRTLKVPALLKPYWSESAYAEYRDKVSRFELPQFEISKETKEEVFSKIALAPKRGSQYGRDIFEEVARLAANVLPLAYSETFDVIHAHDWMTFPAGVALAQLSGKPLVSHVHSLEHDRSGKNVNMRIHQIEGYGATAADAVIAVSHYTRSIINKVHGVPLHKIFVAHNGIYPKGALRHYRKKAPWESKVVLFLGRITFQKGPGYFIDAAAKVAAHIPDVRFVVAGSGDMLTKIMDKVDALGLRKNFLFTGFLKEKEVEKVFSIADLYVMPSVSEPFGISALEAINFDTPAIISRQSGVAEVLDHTMKFDYWDVDRMADLIINALLHDELRMDMIGMAKVELQKLQWDQAAVKINEVYEHVAGPPV